MQEALVTLDKSSPGTLRGTRSLDSDIDIRVAERIDPHAPVHLSSLRLRWLHGIRVYRKHCKHLQQDGSTTTVTGATAVRDACIPQGARTRKQRPLHLQAPSPVLSLSAPQPSEPPNCCPAKPELYPDSEYADPVGFCFSSAQTLRRSLLAVKPLPSSFWGMFACSRDLELHAECQYPRSTFCGNCAELLQKA